MTRTLLNALGFGVLYVGASLLSRALSAEPSHFATFWIASGVYLAVLLRVPASRWPPLVLAACVANIGFEVLLVGRALPIAAAFALANSVEALIGAGLWVLIGRQRHRPGPPDLGRLGDLLRFGLGVSALATAAGAAVGASAVVAAYGGVVPAVWTTWWVADLVGILIVSPILLIRPADWAAWWAELTPSRAVEGLATLGVLVGGVWFIGWGGLAFEWRYLLLPAALWLAVRFRVPGVAIGMPVLSVLAVVGATHGHGPYADTTSVMLGATRLQAFLTVVTLCLLSLAAAVTQARDAAARLDTLNRSLASEVARQTAASQAVATRLRLALEGAEMGTWQWTIGTTEVVLDSRQRAILGIPDDAQLRSALIYARLPPDDIARIRAEFEAWSRAGGLWEYEHRVLDPSGRVRWVAGRAALVQEADGRRLATGVTFDITRQKALAEAQRRVELALRESDERFRQLADHLEAGLWMYDVPARSFRYASSGFSRVWGVDPVRLLDDGSTWLGLVHPDDRGRLRAAFREFVSGERSFDIIYRVQLASGLTRWVQDRAFAVSGEAAALRVVVGLTIDVTAQRLAEEALRDADRQKDDFLAMLAHELRNPLAPIRHATQIIARDDLPAELRTRAGGVVERQMAHVVRLVDDLVDSSRLSRGHLVLRRSPVDLAQVVRDTVGDYEGLFVEGGLQVRVLAPPGPIWADGDATRLTQILGNLLHNARKFTAPGGQVEVELAALPDSGGTRLRVRDTGTGISAELLPRVFEPFSQGRQSLDCREGGLGLGLSLVRGLVELHGGRVAVQSDGVGQGAAFDVWLPATDRPAQDVARAPVVAANRLRVVVVEDNRDAADMLTLVLELSGHDVTVAYTGRDAVASLAHGAPDLILCDIGLPGDMSGLDVARAVRARGLGPVMLVALSGYGGEAHVRDAEAAGFDRYLTKPVGPEELERLLADVAAGRSRAGVSTQAG